MSILPLCSSSPVGPTLPDPPLGPPVLPSFSLCYLSLSLPVSLSLPPPRDSLISVHPPSPPPFIFLGRGFPQTEVLPLVPPSGFTRRSSISESFTRREVPVGVQSEWESGTSLLSSPETSRGGASDSPSSRESTLRRRRRTREEKGRLRSGGGGWNRSGPSPGPLRPPIRPGIL